MHQEDSLSIHFFTLINYEADQLLTMTLKKRDFLVLISINNNKFHKTLKVAAMVRFISLFRMTHT